jgi:hypothetical protein
MHAHYHPSYLLTTIRPTRTIKQRHSYVACEMGVLTQRMRRVHMLQAFLKPTRNGKVAGECTSVG